MFFFSVDLMQSSKQRYRHIFTFCRMKHNRWFNSSIRLKVFVIRKHLIKFWIGNIGSAEYWWKWNSPWRNWNSFFLFWRTICAIISVYRCQTTWNLSNKRKNLIANIHISVQTLSFHDRLIFKLIGLFPAPK